MPRFPGFTALARAADLWAWKSAAKLAISMSALALVGIGTQDAVALANPLPDARQYELVSPLAQGGLDIGSDPAQPALDGNSIAYSSAGAFADEPSNVLLNVYAANRSSSGWLTEGINLPASPPTTHLQAPSVQEISSDGTHTVWQGGDPGLPDQPAGIPNLYLRNSSTGSVQVITRAADPPQFYVARYAVANAQNFSHILFVAPVALTPDAPGAGVFNVYEWVSGTLRLASILPDGSAAANGASAAGGAADAAAPNEGRAISSDGSHVYFTTLDDGQIYLRKAGETTKVTASERVPPETAQPASFLTASSDGSLAFFTTAERLTSDADGGVDLYRWDENAADGHRLIDLTVDTDPNDPGAAVQGVIGASDDASYVYLIADGRLVPGQGVSGQGNLYVWHNGQPLRFIGTLNQGADLDLGQWFNSPGGLRPPGREVSPDGRHLVFMSTAQLTPYDNAGHSEVYSYDYGLDHVVCVSCNPTAEPATGDATLIPARPGPVFTQQFGDGLRRVASDDASRIFFQTSEALVPQDSNGRIDVYEYEGGQVHLISTGTSADDSGLVGVTPTGDDVFFTTRESLLPTDQDLLVDIYDARVGGGFPFTAPPSPCGGDDCKRPPSAAPALLTAASIVFSGFKNGSTGKVKLLTRVVRGSTFLLRVKVPGKGRITISGAGIRTVRRSVQVAGTERLRVKLTARRKRALARRRKLKLKLHVRYEPATGTASTVNFALTVKSVMNPRHERHKRARLTSYDRGGAR